jgi:penicillin-binding protein 1C
MARAALTALAGVALAAGGLAVWIAWPLPGELAAPRPVASLTLEDRHGALLRTTRSEDGSRGGWTPLDEIDSRLIQAFLAAEDHRFFSHPGIDGRAVARAVRDNLRERRPRTGASTLTMQTVRLLRPIERSWTGKVTQALWALRLESHLAKREILEQYLNRVPLGQGAVGVTAAAFLYFGAAPSELSHAQAALLAGIARAPSRDNPLVSAERARARRDVVLGRLDRLGFASSEELQRAREEPVLASGPRSRFLAPHFTTRVLQGWESAGTAPTGAVRTSLDLELQTLLEAEARHTVRVLTERGARHAALVVLDNTTGEALAWVGSPDFWEPGLGQVDMVTSPRQPGSALKPFLFALALDRGHTAATVLPDIPRSYATSFGPYRPQNYDRRFRGPVRLREALASSYNVPSVELAERLGVETVLRTLHAAGFASLSKPASHYGLGLALGNGDVTLLELANAYRALARGGEWSPHRWRHADRETGWAPRERVVSPEAAALVLDILSDADARTPGFGVETPFDFPFPVAVKTGTSRHFTDNWAVGVTRNFTVAVWVGNFTGRPMEGVSGVSGAGPLLYRAMLATATRFPPGALPEPAEAGLTPAHVCRLSGLRATPHCASLVEWFVPGTAPERADEWEAVAGVRLPPEYAEWAGTVRALPAAAGFGHREERLRIVVPQDGDRYQIPAGAEGVYATLGFRAIGGSGAVRWFVNGEPQRSARWRLVPGEHTIRGVGEAGESDEVRVFVETASPAAAGADGERAGESRRHLDPG